MNKTTLLTYTDTPSGIGFLHQMSVSETAPLHTHAGFYEVFFVADGKALHISNEHVDLLNPGSFVFVRPDDVHCYDFYQMDNFEFYNISLSCHEFEKILVLFNHDITLEQALTQPYSPAMQLTESDCLQTIQKIETIRDLISGQQYGMAKLTLKVLISNLFLQYLVQNHESAHTADQVPSWLSELISDMHNVPNLQAGLAQMVSLSGYSQEYLTRMCKKYLDLTPTQFINNLRLNHAAHLIRTTDYGVTDICEESGFHNLSHFHHLFKEAYGISPRSFKQQSCLLNDDTTLKT